MTDNERIAEWLGYFYVDQRIKKPFQDDGPSGWRERMHGPSVSIAFSTDITLWHGEGGLFDSIYHRGHERAVMFTFYLRDVLKMEKGETNFWKYMTATPAQLSSALVNSIEAE